MRKTLMFVVVCLVSSPVMAGQYFKEVDWATLRDMLAVEAQNVRNSILKAEMTYQDLLAVKAGQSNSDFCEQLYQVTPCSADQLTTITDAIAAGTALHQLYGAMTNEVTSQADRAADLRKFLHK